MKARYGLRIRILLPIVIMMIALPVATWYLFIIAANHYTNEKANASIEQTSGQIRDIISKVYNYSDFDLLSDEEKKSMSVMQSKELYQKIELIAEAHISDTRLLLFDNDFTFIYPRGIDDTTCDEGVYNYFYRYYNEDSMDSMVDNMQRIEIGDKIIVANCTLAQNYMSTKNKYIISYIIIDEMVDLISIYGREILVISLGVTLLVAIVIFIIVSGVCNDIKKQCVHSERIGNGDFQEINVHSNIKEIVELNNSMNSMATRLKDADEFQKIFFQNVSHELRTPLMSIAGYAQGIQCNAFEDNEHAAEVIISESSRLTNLVNGILTLSKIDNHQQFVNYDNIDIMEFVEECCDKLGGLAHTKNILLEYKNNTSFDRQNPLLVTADKGLLLNVLQNVISNCINYAKHSVVVSLDYDSDKTYIIVKIQDDGKGFDEESLSHVFDRFYKGKDGNFGIGLAIAKAAIEYMGGSIEALNTEIGAAYQIHIKKTN